MLIVFTLHFLPSIMNISFRNDILHGNKIFFHLFYVFLIKQDSSHDNPRITQRTSIILYNIRNIPSGRNSSKSCNLSWFVYCIGRIFLSSVSTIILYICYLLWFVKPRRGKWFNVSVQSLLYCFHLHLTKPIFISRAIMLHEQYRHYFPTCLCPDILQKVLVYLRTVSL